MAPRLLGPNSVPNFGDNWYVVLYLANTSITSLCGSRGLGEV